MTFPRQPSKKQEQEREITKISVCCWRMQLKSQEIEAQRPSRTETQRQKKTNESSSAVICSPSMICWLALWKDMKCQDLLFEHCQINSTLIVTNSQLFLHRCNLEDERGEMCLYKIDCATTKNPLKAVFKRRRSDRWRTEEKCGVPAYTLVSCDERERMLECTSSE